MNEAEKLKQVRDWLTDPFIDVKLTDREHEAIVPVSHGVPVITIADRLGIERQTAYEAIRRALSKINATRGCDLSLGTIGEYTHKQLERMVK